MSLLLLHEREHIEQSDRNNEQRHGSDLLLRLASESGRTGENPPLLVQEPQPGRLALESIRHSSL